VTSSAELKDICFDFIIFYISYKSYEKLVKLTKQVIMLLSIICLVHLPIPPPEGSISRSRKMEREVEREMALK